MQNFLHELPDSCFLLDFQCSSLIVIASNDQPQIRARKQVVNTEHGRGRAVSGKFWQTGCRILNIFPHTYFPEIQFRQVQQGNGVLMLTVTSQCVRPQLSVRYRTMTSTPADHDHNVFAREESRHSVIQTTVQRMEILGFHNGLLNSQILFPQALVAAGIIELSAVYHPY